MVHPQGFSRFARIFGSVATIVLATSLLVRVRGREPSMAMFGASTSASHPDSSVSAGNTVSAGFTSSDRSGVAPLVVRFEDLSSGGNTWDWDFGDGDVSSVRHPVHTFANPGMYMVRQRVGNGITFQERTELVYVDARPACPAPQNAGYQVLRNVPYGSDGSCTGSRCLDVYLPGLPRACSPTLLYIHGGGWTDGSKNDPSVQALAELLAGEGFFVVVMEYPLSSFLPCSGVPGRGTYPDVIQDCKQAVDWIHQQGTAQFGLSDRVVTVGSSAGGHLASMLAVTQGVEETYFDPEPTGDYSVDRAFVFSGIQNLVKIGCVGNPWLGNCPSLCPGADNCRFLPGCVATGGYPRGYPCSHQTIACRNFDAPESVIGEIWPSSGTPQNVVCGDPLELPQSLQSMPTGNAWYDASPYFWVAGNEAPMHLFHSRCDALVPSYEGIDMATRLEQHGSYVELSITEPQSSCDAGCRHSLFLVIGVFDAVDEIRELLLMTYGG